LNGKAKQYKDPALYHIFLMNNLHYMVTSVSKYASFVLKIHIH
jgi:exocyst complex component 7